MNKNSHEDNHTKPASCDLPNSTKQVGDDNLIQPELFSDSNLDSSNPQNNQSHKALRQEQDGSTKNDVQSQEPSTECADENENLVVTIPHDDPRSIGEILSHSRNRLGFTVERVSSETHIRGDYIQHLEADNFGKLPPATIYTKSYIKSLCRLYSLNSETLIAKYEQKIFTPTSTQNSVGDAQSKPAPNVVPDETPSEQKSKKIFPLTLGWAITILISAVALITAIYLAIDRNSVDTNLPYSSSVEQIDSLITDSDLEQFIIPEQLPLRELPILEDAEVR